MIIINNIRENAQKSGKNSTGIMIQTTRGYLDLVLLKSTGTFTQIYST